MPGAIGGLNVQTPTDRSSVSSQRACMRPTHGDGLELLTLWRGCLGMPVCAPAARGTVVAQSADVVSATTDGCERFFFRGQQDRQALLLYRGPANGRTVLAQATGVSSAAADGHEGLARRRRRQWAEGLLFSGPPAVDRAVLVQLAGVITAATDGEEWNVRRGWSLGFKLRPSRGRAGNRWRLGGRRTACRWRVVERWAAWRHRTRAAERR